MDIIEHEINKFLDKWAINEHLRGQMDIDLHFFMRAVIREHNNIIEPESYTPSRKHNL